MAARRMKGIVRNFRGCLGYASANADSNSNSFGRQRHPSYVRTLDLAPPPTWVMKTSEFRFHTQDYAMVKGLKMLGPHFLYPLHTYPDNPDNERWPFYRPVRQLLTQNGRRLASRPDVVVISMGIAGRAFDVPAPLPGGSIAAPVLTDADSLRAWEESRALWPGAYVRVFTLKNVTVPGEAGRRMGKWCLVDLAPGLAPADDVVFEALRRSRSEDVAEGERLMCAHVVARFCCSSESAAVAAAPPPGGTAGYRNWRDARAADIIEISLRRMAAMIGEPASTKAAETCSAARARALAAAQDAHSIVGRWMSFSEAEAFLSAAACAADAAACSEASIIVLGQVRSAEDVAEAGLCKEESENAAAAAAETSPLHPQQVLDVVDAIMRLGLERPVGIRPADKRLAELCVIHDALVSCIKNDPVDAHPSPTRITMSNGRPIVAVRVAPKREKRQDAKQFLWDSIHAMRTAMTTPLLGEKVTKVRTCMKCIL